MLDVGQVRAFRVNFSGEGSDDYGGPYREVFGHVCEELESCLLPLLIPIPNKRSEVHFILFFSLLRIFLLSTHSGRLEKIEIASHLTHEEKMKT